MMSYLLGAFLATSGASLTTMPEPRGNGIVAFLEYDGGVVRVQLDPVSPPTEPPTIRRGHLRLARALEEVA